MGRFPKESANDPRGWGVGMEDCSGSLVPMNLIKAENREWSWVGGGHYPSRHEVGTWIGVSQGGRSVSSLPEPNLLNPDICNKI